ncbi:MAG: hypothetical protein WBD31_29155, partial [Rubripirellula sp.]
ASYPIVAIRSVLREGFLRNPLVHKHVVLVNEFPKSGGTWFCRMLHDVTGMPFPDNKLPTHRQSIFKQHSIRDYNAS